MYLGSVEACSEESTRLQLTYCITHILMKAILNLINIKSEETLCIGIY